MLEALFDHVTVSRFQHEPSMHAPKTLLKVAILVLVFAGVLYQTKGYEPAGPANSVRGFVPGETTRDEILGKLGKSPIATDDRSDLHYPSLGRPDLNDRFFFDHGKLSLVTSASPDPRYATRESIVEVFGTPEAQTLFPMQQYLDYTQKGLRFICDAAGKTTGILYFRPHPRRVPAGYPNELINLRRKLDDPIPTAAPADFRVGAARVSIVPPQFENLVGDRRLKLHLAEPVFARAAVFERGPERIVLVGVDVFGMGAWDVDRIRGLLADKGFKNVVVAMSHTHANVDTIGFYGFYPKDYVNHVVDKTVVAVLQAAARLQAVSSMRLGSTEMPMDGGRVVDLVRNGRDPGVMDPTVDVLQVTGADGKPIVNLVHLACHPEVIKLERTGGLSPDYVGTLCTDVSRDLGGETVFLNGALGGMITPDTRFRDQKTAETMGHALAKFVVQAAKVAQPTGRWDLWVHRRTVEYPITGEAVVAFMKHPPGPVNLHQGRVTTEMNVVWIGDAQFVTVPGELLPDIGFEIVSKMTGRIRGIIGLANNELGYLIPSFDFRAGGYEERTGPGAAGGEITRSVGLELAPMTPPGRRG
jgi:hypothetical protein